ncbi:MAG: polyprenyl synthetase family protein [Muribaculaceae bacterium]|nr:polyprenyl synthetase family protein [Muribaculaceae bacterium]
MKKISDYAAEAEMALRALKLSEKEPASLYGPVDYALSSGGKRLRPGLVMMSAESFGSEKALDASRNAAAGIEMFHNFTLLHDDVMDHSEMRRGRESVWKKWDATTAILSGDTMLTLATQLVSKVEDDKLRSVLDTFNHMALEVYEGQRLDLDFENADSVNSDIYIEMIRKKTGALLGAAGAIGAIIAGAPEKDVAAMATFGEMLGIAFQIQDDWLDTYGDSSTFGKPIGGDILNDKKTFLLVKAMEADAGTVDALKVTMKELKGEAKIKAVTRIYEKLNLNEVTRQAVSFYTKQALKALKGTSLSEEKREPFRLLVDKLTGRKK